MKSKVANFLSAVILLLGTLVSLAAYAGIGDQIDLEKYLTDKIASHLKSIDAYARVTVAVNLNTDQAPLPGTNLIAQDIVKADQSGRLIKESVKSIDVTIETALAQIPTWLTEEIKVEAGVKTFPVHLIVNKMAQAKLDDLKKMRLAAQELSASTAKKELTPEERWDSNLWPFNASPIVKTSIIAYLLLIPLLILLVLIGWGIGRPKSAPKQDLGSSASKPLAPTVNQLQSQQATRAPVGISNHRMSFSDVTSETLMSVLSDCYWCAEDEYASFIWANLSNVQRDELLKSDFINKEYFSYVIRKEPNDLNLLSHPRYLQPSHVRFVSQADLKALVLENPSLNRMLSPIRLNHLNLSLEQQLKIGKETKLVDASKLIFRNSSLRKLPAQLSIRTLEISDENYILNHLNEIDAEVRSHLTSLIWLAQTAKEYRQEILSQFEARELASAWTGPEEILNILLNDLPLAKREMVVGYLKTKAPDRNCEAFKFMHQAGIVKLNEIQHSEQINSLKVAA